MKRLILGVAGFLLLNVYFNATTHFLPHPILQFLGLLLFFPLAAAVARWNGLPGLRGLGLVRSRTAARHFAMSFVLGFGCWALMYAAYWGLGKFDIVGWKTPLDAVLTLVQIMAGYFFGSLINDLITRGYVLNVLRGKLPPLLLGAVSVAIYALDDFWNGDVTAMNFVFSLALGCSLTYAFLRTGTVWANTGIHFGLNMAYGLLYGLGGSVGGGVWTMREGELASLPNNAILLGTTLLLFAAVYMYYRKSSTVRA
ncbi:CPBP family intramembrane metalloprotease [Paenibacillus antri]|uniref:CPBP family intramembrane metalloprotease n=1 Tax=Paenibacillus antri TaxID=2582848 RepID=A0A5R9GKI9_9BACL|nr:CPBP family intramembrane glutamic endopeptidase [Paenibacillus antri]TLS54018.1 CPBP family intramembrane metalloprotease [Paenibacillus antri]